MASTTRGNGHAPSANTTTRGNGHAPSANTTTPTGYDSCSPEAQARWDAFWQRGEAVFNQITANQITIPYADGRPAITLRMVDDEPEIAVHHRTKGAALILGLNDDDSSTPYLSFFDGDRHMQMGLDEEGRPFVELGGADGRSCTIEHSGITVSRLDDEGDVMSATLQVDLPTKVDAGEARLTLSYGGADTTATPGSVTTALGTRGFTLDSEGLGGGTR